MQKKVMSGSVVPLLDKPKHDKIEDKLSELQDIFYNGDKLTPLEVDIERQYLAEKFTKQSAYKDKPITKFKTHWSISDLNRY